MFVRKRVLGRGIGIGCAALLAVALVSSNASAGLMLTVDEIAFASEGGTNVANLMGTVEIDLSGNMLTITLKNTSTDASSEDASQLLSGVGFDLPNGFNIVSGTVKMNGSTAHNFVKPGDGDVSGEWGFDNDPLKGAWSIAFSDINTGVSSRVSTSDTPFSGAFIETPAGLDGPEFGLWSKQYSTDPGGLNAIEDKVIIKLNLNADPVNDAAFLGHIVAGHTVLLFGSPDSSNVPEATSLITWALLSSIGLCLGWRRRRRRA